MPKELLPKSALNAAASVPSLSPSQSKSPLQGFPATQGAENSLLPKSVLKVAASVPSQSSSQSKFPSHSHASPIPFPPGGMKSSCPGFGVSGQLSKSSGIPSSSLSAAEIVVVVETEEDVVGTEVVVVVGIVVVVVGIEVVVVVGIVVVVVGTVVVVVIMVVVVVVILQSAWA